VLQFIAYSVPGDVLFMDCFLDRHVDECHGKHDCVRQPQYEKIIAEDGEDFMSEEMACGTVRDEEGADCEDC
jgi:hypothetical protein